MHFCSKLHYDTLMFFYPRKTSETIWVSSGEGCWLEIGLLLQLLTHACTLNCSTALPCKAEMEKNREQTDLNSQSLTTSPAAERLQLRKLTVGSLKQGDPGPWEKSMGTLTHCLQQACRYCWVCYNGGETSNCQLQQKRFQLCLTAL